MSVVLLGSTSGSCTLQEQAVAGTTVLTLPTTSGTVLTSASSISASSITTGTLPKAQLPAGSILQVVQGTTTTETSTSSTSFVSTALTATITPSSASSQILVLVSGTLYTGNTGYNTYATMRVTRSGNQIVQTQQITDNQVGSAVGPTMAANVNITYLDSPATTSATAYLIQIKSDQGSYSPVIKFPFSNVNAATITLLEIAA
jgi:hypothetical protein